MDLAPTAEIDHRRPPDEKPPASRSAMQAGLCTIAERHAKQTRQMHATISMGVPREQLLDLQAFLQSLWSRSLGRRREPSNRLLPGKAAPNMVNVT